MMKTKVHIAGIPNGKTQRCERCHCKLEDSGPSYWPIGALVVSRRGGMLAAEQAPENARKCGRVA